MYSKELVILNHEPLTKTVRHNYFMDGLETKGFTILYCDIHPLVIGNIDICNQEDICSCITIFSYDQIKRIIATHQHAVFILAFAENLKSLPILRYLTQYNCRTIRIGIHTAINLSFREKLCGIRSYGWNKIPVFLMMLWHRMLFTCQTIFNPLKAVDIFFYCGENSRQLNSGQQMIAINSFDYEYTCRLQEQPDIPDLEFGRFAVFLDQYYPYHPDIRIDKGKTLTPSQYYNSLNQFFNHIEKILGMEVVIAAHPKAVYQNHEFGNRKLYKYYTAELVKASGLVIAHDSMSISFAILYHRPLILCYTSEFLRMGRSTMPWMRKIAKQLKCPLIPLDDEYELALPLVNERAYAKYKYSYLTSKMSEYQSNIDIITNALLALEH